MFGFWAVESFKLSANSTWNLSGRDLGSPPNGIPNQLTIIKIVHIREILTQVIMQWIS